VVEQYYKSHRITHLGVWTDPDGAAMHALGARGIPTTLILDRQGRESALTSADCLTPTACGEATSTQGANHLVLVGVGHANPVHKMAGNDGEAG